MSRDTFPALLDFTDALRAIRGMCLDAAYFIGVACLGALIGGFIAGLAYAFFNR